MAQALRYIPRRSLLYVPGSSQKMLDKVHSLTADCVVLEMEDGVSHSAKDLARSNIVTFLNNYANKTWVPKYQELGVRINSPQTPYFQDDLHALVTASEVPNALMVPKIDSIDDLSVLYQSIKQSKWKSLNSPINLVIWIESARALISMPEILQAAKNLSLSIPLRLDATVFGSDDYCANIGAERSKTGEETFYARQRFVACCKVFGIQAIDSVYIDIKDLEGLTNSCKQGFAWGFDGKQVIHPSQIELVHTNFTPSESKIKWASELMKEFETHSANQKGAFLFRGQMIDEPLIKQANYILQIVNRISG